MTDAETKVHDLFTTFGNEGSDFEHLLDVGAFRYHLLLQFNMKEPDCAENLALKQIYESFSEGEQDQTNDAVNACMEVLWPFLLSDYKC